MANKVNEDYNKKCFQQMYNEGYSKEDIARHFDVKETYVNQLVKRKNTKAKLPEITYRDKIKKCNANFGIGEWHFATAEEIISILKHTNKVQ